MAFSARKGTEASQFALASALNASRQNFFPVVNCGTAVLVAGTVTVTTGDAGLISALPLTADCRIMLTNRVAGGTQGFLKADPATYTASQFVLASSSGTDTSTVAWEIVQPMYHADVTSIAGGTYDNPTATVMGSSGLVTAADLPTTVALAKQLDAWFRTHLADTVAHKAADTTNVPNPAIATVLGDQTTVDTYLNALQASMNAHLSQAGVHFVNDTVNSNATTAASNLATGIALANSLATTFLAHTTRACRGQGCVMTAC